MLLRIGTVIPVTLVQELGVVVSLLDEALGTGDVISPHPLREGKIFDVRHQPNV